MPRLRSPLSVATEERAAVDTRRCIPLPLAVPDSGRATAQTVESIGHLRVDHRRPSRGSSPLHGASTTPPAGGVMKDVVVVVTRPISLKNPKRAR